MSLGLVRITIRLEPGGAYKTCTGSYITWKTQQTRGSNRASCTTEMWAPRVQGCCDGGGESSPAPTQRRWERWGLGLLTALISEGYSRIFE